MQMGDQKMEDQNINEREPGIFELFLRLLIDVLKRKYLFLGLVIVPTLVSVVVVLWVIPPKYAAKSIVGISGKSGNISNALSGIMGGAGGGLMGSLMGNDFFSQQEIDLFYTILNTKSLHEKVIEKYNLAEHYEHDGSFYADLLKLFRQNLDIELNDEEVFEIRFEDEDYTLPPKVLRFLVAQADSTFTSMKNLKTAESRTFFEERLRLIRHQLDSIQSEFAQFQKENKIYAVEEQMEQTLGLLGNLKLQEEQLKVELAYESQVHGKNTQLYENIKKKRNSLAARMASLKNSKGDGVIFPLAKNEKAFEFAAYEREYKVSLALYGYVRQRYEELLLEESKDESPVVVLQEAWENNKKTSPPRTAIVILVFCFSIVLGIFICAFLNWLEHQKMARAESWNLLEQVRANIKL